MLASFFLLSAVFQAVWQNTTIRYLEYAISGSLMALVISLQTQETDLLALSSVFFLHMVCMLLGALADALYLACRSYDSAKRGGTATEDPLLGFPLIKDRSTASATATGSDGTAELQSVLKMWMWGVHFTAWVPFILAWALIFQSFVALQALSPDMPTEIIGVVIGEFVLFCLFGLTQMAQFAGLVPIRVVNFLFILQSFTSKAFLGYWLAWEIFVVREQTGGGEA